MKRTEETCLTIFFACVEAKRIDHGGLKWMPDCLAPCATCHGRRSCAELSSWQPVLRNGPRTRVLSWLGSERPRGARRGLDRRRCPRRRGGAQHQAPGPRAEARRAGRRAASGRPGRRGMRTAGQQRQAAGPSGSAELGGRRRLQR